MPGNLHTIATVWPSTVMPEERKSLFYSLTQNVFLTTQNRSVYKSCYFQSNRTIIDEDAQL